MHLLLRTLFGLSLFTTFTSCEYTEVNKDAATYCACKEGEFKSETFAGECAKLLASMKKKYEYLPEQQEILVLKIADCMAEE